MVGCAENEFLNENNLSDEPNIEFQAGSAAMTRADISGKAAADKLNSRFVVYGTKHIAAEDGTATNDVVVFDHYNVEWEDNSAGTTPSNSAGWEYVGKSSWTTPHVDQSIKYWDYKAVSGYTFSAFSSSQISNPAQTSDLISVTKKKTGSNKYQKGYEVTIKNGADFTRLYFSDRKSVVKNDFGKPVQFTFRSFGAKVRVGFYETIPGYKVTINKFYYHDHATSPVVDFSHMIDADANYFRAALQNVQTSGVDNKVTVVYNGLGDGENRMNVVNNTVQYNYNLLLGNNIQGKVLGTTSSTAIFDKADASFTDVYPFTANANPMLILCDYTIEAEDGQGEKLEVTGAKAIVPTQYVMWNSNCCYTYLFKISEDTNGTTGSGSDPEGLYPIKFDAMSVSTDVNDQTTLTSVDKYAVTSYRPGADVYLVNTNRSDGTVYIPTAIGDETGNAQVYLVTTSYAQIDEVNINAFLMGTNNGIALEPLKFTTGDHAGQFAASLVYQVPAADGSYYTFGDLAHPGALHFTAEMGHAYAYVYCGTKHVNPTYSKVAEDATYDSTTTYYTYSAGVYSPASGVTSANFDTMKASLYIQSTPEVPGEYAVMLLDTRGY